MRKIKLKKNHIKWIIIIVIAFVLAFRIGVLTPPVFLIKWHFNTNRRSFQNIADLIRDNNYDGWGELLKDENLLISDFIKIKVLFSYSYVRQWQVDNEVVFEIANIAPQPGEAMAIVYSNKKPRDEQYGDWGVEYEYAYEDLGESWYLEYRKR